MSRSPAIPRVINAALVGIATLAAGAGISLVFEKNVPDTSVVRNITVWRQSGAQVGAFRTNGNLVLSGGIIVKGVNMSTGAVLTQSDSDARYVNTSGDAMTGNLVLNGSNVGLTASGQIRGGGNFISSGALIAFSNSLFKGDLTINSDAGATNTVLTFGSDGTNETLTFLNAADRFEFSDDLGATGNIYSSGSVIVRKNSSGTLILGGSFIESRLNDHITIRPRGVGDFRAPRTLGFCEDADTTAATGSGVGIPIPKSMSGMTVAGVLGSVVYTGTTGTQTMAVTNRTDSCEIFSTNPTIDSAEASTETAATPAVVNSSCNKLTTADILVYRITALHTTPAKGTCLFLNLIP